MMEKAQQHWHAKSKAPLWTSLFPRYHIETFPPHKRISLTSKALPPPSQIVTFSSSCPFWLRVFLIYRHLIAASASSVFLRLAFPSGTFMTRPPDCDFVLSMISPTSNLERGRQWS